MKQEARVRILFLAANPTDTDPLRLDKECRTIEERLLGAPFRDRFELVSRWALRVQDIQAALLRCRPEIVHFSGHGGTDGSIALENSSGGTQAATTEALVTLFQLLKETVRCVVLNACHSDVQARALSQHLDCVVGMSTSIGDEAAIAFSSAFYQALACGECVDAAFRFGQNQIQLEGLGEELTPTLHLRTGLKPFRFVTGPASTPPAAPSAEILSAANVIETMLLQQSSPDAMLGTHAMPPVSFFSGLAPSTTLPSPVDRHANRTGSVGLVSAAYSDHSYVAIYGGCGTGKTQLAILSANAFSGKRIWIPLRQRSDGAALKISVAVLGTERRFQSGSRLDALRKACQLLPPDSMIVLDDLPVFGGQDDFDSILIELCLACRESQVRLLSTGARRLPRRIRDLLGTSLAEIPAPEFLDEEAEELFRSYGAPDAFLRSKWRSFAQVSAKQHPVLLVEAARYLAARNWTTSDDVFDDLILGRFARSLDMTTTGDIVRTVPDAQTRELLYRLRLFDSPFESDQIAAIASVSPAISAPLERIADLLGLWVQQDSESAFIVSPLVSSLDDNNTLPDVKKHVHAAIASGIMHRVFQKGTFGPEEAFQAIVQYVRAEDFDGAGTVLVMALHGMSTERMQVDPFGLTSIWIGMPLPTAMNHETKVGIRALQVVVRHRLGRSIEDPLDDFQALLGVPQASERSIVRIGVQALVGLELMFERPEAAIHYFLECIHGLDAVDPNALRTEERGWGNGLFTLFWMAGFAANSSQSFATWFQALQSFKPRQLAVLRTVQFADRCCDFVCIHIWMREADRPTNERDWDGAIRALDDIARWARTVNFTLLEACALRAQIVVHAEYRNDLVSAIRIGEAYLAEPREAIPRFVVRDIVARQLAYQNHIDQSLEWFASAMQDAPSAPTAWCVEALANAGCAASKGSREIAVTYFDEAIRLFDANQADIPPLWWVKITAEKALVQWRLGRRDEAFHSWSTATERLLALMNPQEDWITLYLFIGGYTSYFLQRASGIASLLADTFEPTPGRLLLAPARIAEAYEPGHECRLAGAMAFLADTLLHFDEAIKWGNQFLRMAPPDGDRTSRISFGLYALPTRFDVADPESILVEALNDDDFAAKAADTDAQQMVGVSRSAATIKVALVVLALGRLTKQDPDSALSHAIKLSSLIRSANVTNDPFWIDVAAILAEFLTTDSTARLFAVANSTHDNAIKMIAGLASVYDSPLNQAASAHITHLQQLEKYGPKVVFRLMIAPIIREFWSSGLERLVLQPRAQMQNLCSQKATTVFRLPSPLYARFLDSRSVAKTTLG